MKPPSVRFSVKCASGSPALTIGTFKRSPAAQASRQLKMWLQVASTA